MPKVESREQKAILENSLPNKEKEPNNSTERAEILLKKRELLSTLFDKSKRLNWELDCPDNLKNDIEISISFFSAKLAQPQIQARVTASASPGDAALYDRISKALNSNQFKISQTTRKISIFPALFLLKMDLEESGFCDDYLISDLLDCLISYFEDTNYNLEEEFNDILSTQDNELKQKLISFRDKIINNEIFPQAFADPQNNRLSSIIIGELPNEEEITRIKEAFSSDLSKGKIRSATIINKVVTKDSDLMLSAATRHWFLFQKAHRSLKHDPVVALKAVEIDGRLYRYLPKQVRERKEIALAALKTADVIEFVPPTVKSDVNFWVSAVKNTTVPFSTRGIPLSLTQDESFMRDAVRLYIFNIEQASKEVQDKLLADEAFVMELIGKNYSLNKAMSQPHFKDLCEKTQTYRRLLAIGDAINELAANIDKKDSDGSKCVQYIKTAFNEFCLSKKTYKEFVEYSKKSLDNFKVKKHEGLKFFVDKLLIAIRNLFKKPDDNFSFFAKTNKQKAAASLEKTIEEENQQALPAGSGENFLKS